MSTYSKTEVFLEGDSYTVVTTDGDDVGIKELFDPQQVQAIRDLSFVNRRPSPQQSGEWISPSQLKSMFPDDYEELCSLISAARGCARQGDCSVNFRTAKDGRKVVIMPADPDCVEIQVFDADESVPDNLVNQNGRSGT